MIYFQLFSYKLLYICLKWCTKRHQSIMTNALYIILYLLRFFLLANFFFFHFWLIDLFIQQPIRNINNLDSLILIFIMPGSGYHILRVCILNLQKRSYLSFKGLLFTDIIRYLNIDFLTPLHCDKIYFLLI